MHHTLALPDHILLQLVTDWTAANITVSTKVLQKDDAIVELHGILSSEQVCRRSATVECWNSSSGNERAVGAGVGAGWGCR